MQNWVKFQVCLGEDLVKLRMDGARCAVKFKVDGLGCDVLELMVWGVGFRD